MKKYESVQILVADGDVRLREHLKYILEKEGYSVGVAEDGNHVFHTISSQNNVHILVCDVFLSGKSGLQILKEGMVLNPHLKIILTTNYGEVEQYLATMNMGAFEYMIKPFPTGAFLEVISRAVGVVTKNKRNDLSPRTLY